MNKFYLFLIYLICFLEGGVLMSNELLNSKLLAVSFGSSNQSWAILLAVTLLALAAGYFIGGNFSKRYKKSTILLLIFVFLVVYQFLYLEYTSFLIHHLMSFSLIIGTLLFCFFSLAPLIFCLGLVSPLLISLLFQLQEAKNNGIIAGRVYAVSTFGGVLATFTIGLFVLPEYGMQYTNILLSFVLLASLVILFVLKKLIL